eukprot:Tbor_TRINITY_DN5884_c1_g1::TRINITY_DN5884_c1_g1_i1::g.7158::m.7158
MPIKHIEQNLPEMEPLNENQQIQVNNFINKYFQEGQIVYDTFKDYTMEDLTIVAYKFLIARSWDDNKAYKMFEETMKFRKERALDTSSYFPSVFSIRGYDTDAINKFFNLQPAIKDSEIDKTINSISRYYKVGFHYWDKTGHPILIEMSGKVKLRQLLAKLNAMTPPGDDISLSWIDMHLHQNECGGLIVKYQDATKGKAFDRRIKTVTVILDFEGLDYSMLIGEAVDVLKKTWAIDAAYYPEGMHRLFAVNCPSMIVFAFNLVKGFLDTRIQEKIHFSYKGECRDVLLQVIDEDKLPVFLGGTCQCEGGCVGHTDDGTDPAEESHEEIETEEVTITHGKTETRVFDLEEGDKVVWSFDCITKKDISFSVKFVPVNGVDEIVLGKHRTQKNTDCYTAIKKGRVIVELGNEFSWLKSKVLRLRVFKC